MATRVVIISDPMTAVLQNLAQTLHPGSTATLEALTPESLANLNPLDHSDNETVVVLSLAYNREELVGFLRTKRNAGCRIVVPVEESDAELIRFALSHRASAIIDRKSGPQEFVGAVNSVLRGQPYISPSLAEAVAAAALPPPKDATPHITPRERAILPMVAHGDSSVEIATKLSISKKTVEYHRARLLAKFHVHSSVELIRLASAVGLLG